MRRINYIRIGLCLFEAPCLQFVREHMNDPGHQPMSGRLARALHFPSSAPRAHWQEVMEGRFKTEDFTTSRSRADGRPINKDYG